MTKITLKSQATFHTLPAESLQPPSPLAWDQEDCSQQQRDCSMDKRLWHGHMRVIAASKAHMWVLLAQSGHEISQTCQLFFVTSSLLTVYAWLIQTYLYSILLLFLLNLFELCLTLLSSRECPVISPIHGEKSVIFLRVKRKKIVFQSLVFVGVMMTEIMKNNHKTN